MKNAARIACAAAFMAACAVPAAAERENSLEAGAWALQFSVQGDLITVSSFDGGLALKRHFSPGSALRMSVAAHASDTGQEYTGGGDSEAEYDAAGVQVGVLYQRYVDPDADAHLYWGVGPFAGWAGDSFERMQGDTLTSSNEADWWSVGLDAVLGVEWFATRVISFHAEYIGSAQFTRQKDSAELLENGVVVDSQERTVDRWSIAEGGAVRFGLSVYF